MFSSISMSGACITNFYLLDHLLNFMRRFPNTSVLDASIDDQFNFHFKKAY